MSEGAAIAEALARGSEAVPIDTADADWFTARVDGGDAGTAEANDRRASSEALWA
jgi:hypothetical protein